VTAEILFKLMGGVEQPEPKPMEAPVVGKFLEGFTIFLCGVDDPDESSRVRRLVSSLGGTATDQLSALVNFAFVQRVGRSGYTSLKDRRIPCVRLRWLYDCRRERTLLPYAAYQVPLLCGLTVSCTQISPTDRAAIKSIVVNNGGIFSDQLVRDKSTHLIAVQPRGDKYVYAVSWKTVHVVTIQWLQECVRKAGEPYWVAIELMYLPTHSSIYPSIVIQSGCQRSTTTWSPLTRRIRRGHTHRSYYLEQG
jgi:hypothetical protein